MFAKSYARFYDELNRGKSYKQEIGFVYRWANAPASILDIGCGTAKYWNHFPVRTKMVGVERSAGMIAQSPYKNRIIQGDVSATELWETPPFNFNFDAAIALFDVLNYIPRNDWWQSLPLKPGGLFIFDIWDAEKVHKDGFRATEKKAGDLTRVIEPLRNDDKVYLSITLYQHKKLIHREQHVMYVHCDENILRFCGDHFVIADKIPTDTWQTWWKLKRKE